MWIIRKAKHRNSLQGNSEVTAVHLAKGNQLLGWNKVLNDLLVEWLWLKYEHARNKNITKRKIKTYITEDQQQLSYSSARCRQPTGDKLMLWLCRDAAHSGASPRLCRGAGDTGWAPPFSPPHLPIPTCFQTWLSVLEGGRAAGKTGQWHPHTLPTGDDRQARGGSMFLG